MAQTLISALLFEVGCWIRGQERDRDELIWWAELRAGVCVWGRVCAHWWLVVCCIWQLYKTAAFCVHCRTLFRNPGTRDVPILHSGPNRAVNIARFPVMHSMRTSILTITALFESCKALGFCLEVVFHVQHKIWIMLVCVTHTVTKSLAHRIGEPRCQRNANPPFLEKSRPSERPTWGCVGGYVASTVSGVN